MKSSILKYNKFSRNAMWLIFVKVYQIGINLFISMMMARYLGPSNYGLINYAASFTGLFTSFCTLGINSILVNELIQNRYNEGKILGSSIILRLLSSLFSLFTIGIIVWILNPNDYTTFWIVLIYSSTLIFQCFDTINYWYQSNLESKTTALISSVGYTIIAIFKAFLLVTEKNIYWFAASHTIEIAIVAFLLFRCYQRDKRKGQNLNFSLKVSKSLLSKSYHFILSGLMVAIYGQMDRIMLKQMIGDSFVGYYSAATSICSMWTFVLSAIIDSAKPIILESFEKGKEIYNTRLVQLYGAIIYISFAVALLITIFSKYIILILYGKEYLPAQSTLCIVSWSTAFSYLGVARSIWLVSNKQQKYEKYIAAIGAFSNLLLNTILIPRWGVNGAAFATLVTQIITNFIVGFFISNIRENNILILRSFKVWNYLK